MVNADLEAGDVVDLIGDDEDLTGDDVDLNGDDVNLIGDSVDRSSVFETISDVVGVVE